MLWYCIALCVFCSVMVRRRPRRREMFGEWAPSWYLSGMYSNKVYLVFHLIWVVLDIWRASLYESASTIILKAHF